MLCNLLIQICCMKRKWRYHFVRKTTSVLTNNVILVNNSRVKSVWKSRRHCGADDLTPLLMSSDSWSFQISSFLRKKQLAASIIQFGHVMDSEKEIALRCCLYQNELEGVLLLFGSCSVARELNRRQVYPFRARRTIQE